MSILSRIVLALLLIPPCGGACADDFYAGKTISIIVSGGGAYEAYARTVARHMPRFIPGHPAMIVQQMPGAGGARAASHLYNIAPRDGTVIGGLHGAVITAPMLGATNAEFDVTKFSWIGSVTADTYIGYVWHTSPVQSLAEAKTKQLILGGSSLGGNGIDMPIIGKELFGFKFKIVAGYKTSADTKLALEKGEIEGTFANLISSLKQTDWLQKGLVRVIVQHGSVKNPELPDVPLFREFASNDTERRILDIMDVRGNIARPYLAPPGVPAANVDTLRRAFDAMLIDPMFLADMRRQRFEVEGSMNGETLAAKVNDIARTPPEITQRLVALFNNYKEGR